jgi:hypothetical protein
MLETVRGAPAGHTVHTYRSGETYSPETEPPLSEELGALFLRDGMAERTEDEPDALRRPLAQGERLPQGRAAQRAARRTPGPSHTK